MAEPDHTAASETGTEAGASGNILELGRVVETGVERVRRLQRETHALAQEQVEILARDMEGMALRMGEIAEGGDAYPIGVRELSSRMADELAQQAKVLLAIMERVPKV
jgi:hypothetical protein